MGRIILYIMENKKMFETTNQISYCPMKNQIISLPGPNI